MGISRPAGLLLVLAATLSCAPAPDPRPNILWIVWDTVRADHLGLHGHERDTTPFLDEWAKGARVYDDCLSPAGYTLPSHASMFTGLLPSEHCTHNGNKRLADGFTTVAELLRESGYRTYLYSANPHVSETGNLHQGFEVSEHPWSPQFAEEAVRIIREKLPEEDESSELIDRFRAAERGELRLTPWNIKAAGELAGRGTLDWLNRSEDGRPFFVFLNYMEAHRPYIPPRPYRERMMTPDDVERSYKVDRSWIPMWEYTFGLRDYEDDELALTRATYDAGIAELDDHLRKLIGALEAGGHLDDTMVVLTSDHGEHLGEQHMFDHQYSVYQAVLRVPLVIHYPPRFDPGRDARPVMTLDLFPTLLELAGIAPPDVGSGKARSLLSAEDERVRFAEEPAHAKVGLRMVQEEHPDWDATPWQRRLQALVVGDDKLIRGSDDRSELFDLAADPFESRELSAERSQRAAELEAGIDEYVSTLDACLPGAKPDQPLTPEQEELLRGLGYLK